MKICCNGHDEICYIGKDCPVCVRDMEIFHHLNQLAEFRVLIESLEQQLKEMKGGKDE